MAIKTTHFEVYPRYLSVLGYLDSLSDKKLYLLAKEEDLGTRPQPPAERKYGKVSNIVRLVAGAKTNKDLSSEYSTASAAYLVNNSLYNQRLDFVKELRRVYHQDFRRLIALLKIEPTSIDELDDSYRTGYVSKAELDFFKSLQRRFSNSSNYNLWHQVTVPEIDHKVDALICRPRDHLFAVEFDGPHHCEKWRFSKDSNETEKMRKFGFNVIRVGLQRFAEDKTATLDRVFAVVAGKDPPEQDFLGDQTVIDGRIGTISPNRSPVTFIRDYEKDANSFYNEAKITKCFLYCQTTGVGPEDQVIDIGLLFYPMDRSPEEFYSKIRPSCPVAPNAAKLHSLTAEKLERSPSLQDLLHRGQLRDILVSDPQLITYDWSFLEPKLLNTLEKKDKSAWNRFEKHSLVNEIREKYGLDSGSTINDALDRLNIPRTKYRRYDSMEFARLMQEIYEHLLKV